MSQKPLFDPAIQSEDIAFRPEELVACPKCSRSNPPNRLECFYCGGELGVVRAGLEIKLSGRRLEAWEKGFNVIATAMHGADASAAAGILGYELDHFADFAAADVPLPIARLEKEQEAAIIAERLEAAGLTCKVVADAELAAEKPLVRLSSIEFRADELSLIDFNTHERHDAPAADLALIVVGVISSTKTDSLEKRKRGGTRTVLNESAVSTDEPVIDLYLRNDPTGFRIHATGFDFSCLGDDMRLIASDNMRLLVTRLTDLIPTAKLVDSYRAVRHWLDDIWPQESRKDPQGRVRSGFGKKGFGMSESSNNLQQFTKFSRMQWHLL